MPEQYDFNFICLSLGLIPIKGDTAAIAPGAITDIEYNRDSGEWTITLDNSSAYILGPAHMAELERNIKARSEEAKILQREGFKHQITMQNEVAQELQRGVNVIGAKLVEKRRH